MATRLTKKQKEALTDKITGLIRNGPSLRMTTDSSVNELNINQISGELNRIHYRAVGKDLPTVISFEPKQLGSGDPSPDNIRPIVGYEIDGIGTVYGGELNIDTGALTVTYGLADLGSLGWTYLGNENYPRFYSSTLEGTARQPMAPPTNRDAANMICTIYPTATVDDQYLGRAEMSIGLNISARIYVRDAAYTNAALFKAAMSGVMLAYELATPVTYTLTLQQMIQLLDQI